MQVGHWYAKAGTTLQYKFLRVGNFKRHHGIALPMSTMSCNKAENEKRNERRNTKMCPTP